MRRGTLPLLAFLAFALPTACGGATDQYDLLGGGTSSGGVHDAGSEAPSQSGSSGGGLDAAVQADTGVTFDSGGGPVDTGIGIPEASPVETGGGGTDFSCPPATCTSPEVCCATGTGQGNTPTYKCQSATKACGSTADPGSPISCATTADCNGEVCCGENDNGFYTKVSCAATCTGTTTGGATLVQFCDPAANDCPAPATCQPSQVLAGFNVCN